MAAANFRTMCLQVPRAPHRPLHLAKPARQQPSENKKEKRDYAGDISTRWGFNSHCVSISLGVRPAPAVRLLLLKHKRGVKTVLREAPKPGNL